MLLRCATPGDDSVEIRYELPLRVPGQASDRHKLAWIANVADEDLHLIAADRAIATGHSNFENHSRTAGRHLWRVELRMRCRPVSDDDRR